MRHVSVVCVTVWVWFLNVSLSGRSLVVGSLWNVSACFFYGGVSVAWEVASGAYPMVSPHSILFYSILVYSILFYSILPYPILFLLYSILFYSAMLGYIIIYYRRVYLPPFGTKSSRR